MFNGGGGNLKLLHRAPCCVLRSPSCGPQAPSTETPNVAGPNQISTATDSLLIE